MKEKEKIVEVWLTNADQSDEEVLEYVEELKQKYAKQKFKTVKFLSGSQDLEECTEELLCHNLGF